MQILYSQQVKLEEEVRRKEEMLLPSPYYMPRTEVDEPFRDQRPNASYLAEDLRLKEEELRLKDEKILFLSKQLEHQQLYHNIMMINLNNSSNRLPDQLVKMRNSKERKNILRN